ncbi:MAG: translation initiation factor [Kofleriaceae bacterium]
MSGQSKGPKTPPPKSDPFAALEKLRGSLPPGPAAAPAAPAKPVKKGLARAVVRMERKGRGGKEVTIVEKLGLPPTELDQWCRDLKQALGCGGATENGAIVLQGDLRQRVGAVLEQKGVERVTIAN